MMVCPSCKREDLQQKHLHLKTSVITSRTHRIKRLNVSLFYCALLSTNKLTAKDKLIDIVCDTQYTMLSR